jgi:hypothetical protein
MANGRSKKTAECASKSGAANKKREATLSLVSFIPHAHNIEGQHCYHLGRSERKIENVHPGNITASTKPMRNRVLTKPPKFLTVGYKRENVKQMHCHFYQAPTV